MGPPVKVITQSSNHFGVNHSYKIKGGEGGASPSPGSATH